MMTANDVLNFWFQEIEPKLWFTKDPAFDEQVRSRFLTLHAQASRCETFLWRKSPEGRLAEILVLDQFPRNMFRDQPAAFASDSLALALSQEAVAQGCDWQMTSQQKIFLYMPHMHSESSMVHEQAVKLFSQPGLENNLDFEIRHKKIIDRFGRFPHRNAILGRVSTAEELEFLKQPGSGF
jgi:uncharacterized protein (DUF924 family)